MTTYPQTTEDGRTLWACCESTIGPVCQHLRPLTEAETRALMDAAHTDADRSNYGAGWHLVSSWGRDGWDLGRWPYVKVSHREQGGRFDVMTYCEGDRDVYSCATEADRDSVTDFLAWFYWEGESWVQGLTFDTLPGGLRGPFSWARCDAVPRGAAG